MSSLDPQEIQNFEALSATWWDPIGPFKPLHRLNPSRLHFVRQQLEIAFDLDKMSLTPYQNLSLLDVGCGGGLLTEPLARCGGQVTGIDAGAKTIATAQWHADAQGLAIQYVESTAEAWAAQGLLYDVVIAMEVVEHVMDVASFIQALSALLKPGGVLLLSTLNRTLKSYALAIIGAEYILRWVPRRTHDWSRFLTPAELSRHCRAATLTIMDIQGMTFRPLSGDFVLSKDVGVNYLLSARKRDS